MEHQFKYGFFGQLQTEEAYRSKLKQTLSSAGRDESKLENAITNGEEAIDIENMTIDQYKELLEVTKEGSPLNRMYGGIKMFQVQGMCGMDMGKMGEFVDCDMMLTGQELLDISELLNGNCDGKMSPADLAKALQDKGYNAEVTKDEDGNEQTGITLTRSDGSKVTFCDANGDGQLNGCDYDFSAALKQLEADMKVYEENIKAIEEQIDKHIEKSEQLQEENEDNESDLEEARALKAETQEELDKTETTIERIGKQIEIEEAKAKAMEEATEPTDPTESTDPTDPTEPTTPSDPT